MAEIFKIIILIFGSEHGGIPGSIDLHPRAQQLGTDRVHHHAHLPREIHVVVYVAAVLVTSLGCVAPVHGIGRVN